MSKNSDIRDAIKLKIENLAYFEKVYKKTKNNIQQINLPAVTVVILGGVNSSALEEINLSLRVEIHDINVNIEDALDTHAEKINPLLTLGQTLSGLIEGIVPESFDYNLDPESDYGVLGLNFNVKYEV